MSPFAEGTILAPGASLEQLVRVSPTVVGPNTDVWQLNANDGQGLRLVTMTVSGMNWPAAAPAPAPAPATTSSTTPATPDSTDTLASQGAAGTAEVSGTKTIGGCAVAGAASPWDRPLGLFVASVAVALARRRRSSSSAERQQA